MRFVYIMGLTAIAISVAACGEEARSIVPTPTTAPSTPAPTTLPPGPVPTATPTPTHGQPPVATPTPTSTPMANSPTPTPTVVPPSPVPIVTPDPTSKPTPTKAPSTPTPVPFPFGSCDEFLSLLISAEGEEEESVVTSYQCGALHVDSTGRYPSRTPTFIVPQGSHLRFRLGAERQPTSVELRIYAGAGVSGSFFKWPEELPTDIEPLDTVNPTHSLTFRHLLEEPPGEYSLVVRAVWQEDATEVFYAKSVEVE